MSKSVVILCLNGRRRTIKFTPNSTVAQIIEDVCIKESVDPTAYDLRTSRTVLDRTLPWRFTNLPNNAKLELCSRESDDQSCPAVVKIAFQLPDNQRLTADFSTSSYLMDIVQHFSDHLIKFEPTDHSVTPSINYLRQKFVGNKVLASTTLQRLGITKGSALLRFSYESAPNTAPSPPSQVDSSPSTLQAQHSANPSQRSPNVSPKLQNPSPRAVSRTPPVVDIPMHDSDAESERRVKPPTLINSSRPVDHSGSEPLTTDQNSSAKKKVKRKISATKTLPAKRSKSEAPPSSSRSAAQNDFSNFKFPAETKGLDLQAGPQTPIGGDDLLSACERRAVLFNEKNRQNRETVQAEESDDFFEVTVDDLRKMMADLKHERKKLEEQEMLTEDQRKSRKQMLASKYPLVVLRIVLPERVILQGFFRPLEKVRNIYDFVKEHVNVQSFYLFTTPPKKILKDENLSLFDNNLVPAARIYIGSDKAPCANNLIKESSSHLLRTIEEANQDLKSLKK